MDCWNLSCMVTETTGGAAASALPSIYIPPWAGGEPCRAVDGIHTQVHTLPKASEPSASRIHSGNGTSTNCSAVCGTGRTRRGGGRGRLEILGTSISCAGTKRSTICSTFSKLSTICGTGAPLVLVLLVVLVLVLVLVLVVLLARTWCNARVSVHSCARVQRIFKRTSASALVP